MWLAVLAILLQTLLPDLGMAARARAQAQEHAAAQTLHHGHADGAETAPVPEPEPKHAHDTTCPFCLALANHALVPASGGVLATPHAEASEGPVANAGIVPALSFLTCLRPRAPPHAERA